jgi:hypothetical protein
VVQNRADFFYAIPIGSGKSSRMRPGRARIMS